MNLLRRLFKPKPTYLYAYVAVAFGYKPYELVNVIIFDANKHLAERRLRTLYQNKFDVDPVVVYVSRIDLYKYPTAFLNSERYIVKPVP